MTEEKQVPSLDSYDRVELQFLESSEVNPKGASSLLTRQLILHQYSPRVSVISSELVDGIVSKYKFENFLDFLQCFEDDLYGVNSFLSNKVHVKFVKPFDEILRTQHELKNDRRNNLNSELFDMSILKPDGQGRLNYLKLINQVSSSETLLPFETFNHPISQLMVISLEDTLQTVKTLINDWKYLNYPKWIDMTNMFVIFLIVVDSSKPESLQQLVKLQEHLKLQLNYRSVIVVHQSDDDQLVELKPPLGSTITSVRSVGSKFKQTMTNMIVDFINKFLLPFMERKIHHWNEDVVNPRKSITGRFFNVSKRWGNSSSQDQSSSQQNYNSQENFYYITSNEFIIRKLGDWYFMLRDFKKSYTTYELLKKDFLNDKSWNYLASLQEFMIISLLIGSSQKISMIGNGITMKIINDLINPMIDSFQYSYLSRCYLKTYSLRSILTIAELFISLSESNQLYKINNNNNFYFDASVKLFSKLIDLNLIDELNKPVIMKRISYIYNIYYLDLRVKQKDAGTTNSAEEEEEEKKNGDIKSAYLRDDYEIIGMTRYRKSELWEYLANRQLQESI